jgi:hypothetical protein
LEICTEGMQKPRTVDEYVQRIILLLTTSFLDVW